MLVHSRLFRRLHVFRKSIGSHGDNRYCICVRPVKPAYRFCGFVSVHNRHHNVHKNNLVRTGRRPVKQVHGLLSVMGHRNLQSHFRKHILSDLLVQFVILHKKGPLSSDSCPNGRDRFIFFPPLGRIGNFQRQNYGKNTAHITFAFNLYAPSHFVYQRLCNGHSKAAAFVICPGSGLLLGKRFKNMFQIVFPHSDAGVGYFKTNLCRSFLLGHLMTFKPDGSSGFIVFYGVARYINQNLFYMQRTSHKIIVRQPFRLIKIRDQLNIPIRCLPAYNHRTIIQQFPQVKYLFGKLNVTVL